MSEIDKVLESLRPRMRAARRRFGARVLGAAAAPVACIVVILLLVAGEAPPRVTETQAPPPPSHVTTTAVPALRSTTVVTSAPPTTVTEPSPSAPATTVASPAAPSASVRSTPAPSAPTTTGVPAPTTSPAPRAPFAGAPRCPTHDPRAWHSLWDAARGCYYDHEHKDDPHELDAVFGKDFYVQVGGDLGLPWRVAGDRSDGRGSGWLVRGAQGCVNAFGTGCVTDVRVQYNALFSGPGAIERYRSAYVEARGCVIAQPQRCGVARLGGAVDYGALWVDDVRVPLPDQPVERGGTSRNHFANGYATWFGRNPLFDLALITNRTWGPIDRADPNALQLACSALDGACRRDASRVGLHILAFSVPAALDTDGDGLVTWSGWYDPMGNVAPGCARASAACVPVSFAGMPVGTYQYRDDGHGYGDDGRADYDIAPPGALWIAYPN